MGFDIDVYAAITENVARGGQGSLVGTHLAAKRTDISGQKWLLLAVVKVKRWGWCREGGQGLDSAVVL